jgi:hypothetical protein
VAFEAQADGDYQRIQITADVNGILVIRFQVGQALQSAKVWIQSGR